MNLRDFAIMVMCFFFSTIGNAATVNFYTFDHDGAIAGNNPDAVLDAGSSSLVLSTNLVTPNNLFPSNFPYYIANLNPNNTLAMHFDGDADILQANRPEQAFDALANPRTWDCWFRVVSPQPGGRGALISERRSGRGASDYAGMILWIENGKLAAYLSGRGGGALFFTPGSTNVNDGLWHHVGVLWLPSGELALYLDGKPETLDTTAETSETMGSLAGSDIYLTIGASQYWSGSGYLFSYLFLGDIDQVRISDQELINGGYVAADNPNNGNPGLPTCESIPDALKNPADIDGDCWVGLLDLALLAQNWLTCVDPNGCFSSL